MALIQVGIAALRSPTGEFLSSIPIMKEIVSTNKDVEFVSVTESELEKLFIERMKKYINAKDGKTKIQNAQYKEK